MKKYIFGSLFLLMMGSGAAVHAQDFDVKPSVQLEQNKFKFTAGGRFMSDAAYYKTDFTNMKSGAAIVDARIRTSLSYENWYFYADFDFGRGNFTQKNLFLQYTFDKGSCLGTHSLKAGYYNEPSSMGNNTSLYSYHFMTRAASSSALQPHRSLGITYKYYDNHFLLNQGVFAENKYNDQIKGFQGVSVSGRWLFKAINNEDHTFHVGLGARYARMNTGELEDGVLKTQLSLTSPLHTLVDNTDEYLNAQIPWAKNVYDINVEALYRNPKFFARGEYTYKHISKDRDDKALFHNQLGGVWSWTTLDSWQAGNPIGSNEFRGGYVEMGYQIFGDGYRYSDSDGVLLGNAGRALEVVARYNYTKLNDIKDNDVFLYGKNKFYPNGDIKDYPAVTRSVGGGRVHSATLGVNFTFNKYAQVMLDYTYNRLDNVHYPMDKDFHNLQARVMFAF
ncbi:porin [Bacteroides sp.]|uniref:porin n=1 Tax=Bacteroides sp. TaxID=29523 RepID=UPI00258B7541|nr:porin [Bacteroides sp.]